MAHIRMRIPRRRVGAAVVAAVAVAVAATGCSTDSSPAGDRGSGNYSIAFVPKNLGIPYFVASATDGKAAVEGFGGGFQEVAPTQPTPAGQVPFLNTLMQQGVGGIAISAVDPKAPCDALKQARDAGVKVVTFDSDTDPSCRDLFVNQATAEGIASAQVDIIAE